MITPYFVDYLDYEPERLGDPPGRVLRRNYGLRYDRWLVIAIKGSRVNGANIPKFAQPVLGAPLSRKNRHWSCFHDVGYGDTVRIIDMSTTTLDEDYLVREAHLLDESMFVPKSMFDQDWFDVMARDGSMVAAKCWRIKRYICYQVLSMFGWYAWSKNKRVEQA